MLASIKYLIVFVFVRGVQFALEKRIVAHNVLQKYSLVPTVFRGDHLVDTSTVNCMPDQIIESIYVG